MTKKLKQIKKEIEDKGYKFHLDERAYGLKPCICWEGDYGYKCRIDRDMRIWSNDYEKLDKDNFSFIKKVKEKKTGWFSIDREYYTIIDIDKSELGKEIDKLYDKKYLPMYKERDRKLKVDPFMEALRLLNKEELNELVKIIK